MQMAITIAVVAGGFYTIDQRSQTNKDTIDKVEVRIESLDSSLRAKVDSSVSPLEARVRLLETANARSDERLNSILSIVTGINEKLERIESRVNSQ